MAKAAAIEYGQDSAENTARMTSFIFARLVMVVSWSAVIVLGWIAVVSPDIRWRFAAMFMSALVLAPTLVLAFRQVAREAPMLAAREEDQPAPEVPAQDGVEVDDGQTGIYVDQSTGLASKRYLNMFLLRELKRSERAQAALSVGILDVDGYQNLEDKAGVGAATTALADVGARLKSALREYDLVARYAPGRLALVLPEAGARHAAEVVERLHKLATTVCVDGDALSVTIGLASFPDNGTTAEELINSAHRALNRGRFDAANTVHSLEEFKKAS